MLQEVVRDLFGAFGLRVFVEQSVVLVGEEGLLLTALAPRARNAKRTGGGPSCSMAMSTRRCITASETPDTMRLTYRVSAPESTTAFTRLGSRSWASVMSVMRAGPADRVGDDHRGGLLVAGQVAQVHGAEQLARRHP